MKLTLLSDFGETEKLITENATAADIADIFSTLDWQNFHQLVLEQGNENWLEVSGDLQDAGLSVMYEENGHQFVIVEPPKTVEQLQNILLDYLNNPDDIGMLHEFS